MYESFYGLKAKPFQLNPDPEFFFGSRGHRRAMAYLEYGLHQNEGFIVITGEIGAGKTTIVRNLLDKLDSEQVVAAQLVSTQLDSNNILRLVAAAFGIPSKSLDKADLLLALEAFLVTTTAAGKRALLVVDEAQNLTAGAVEELRMLSNFQLEDHALLQSFLIGQPEFREMMQSPEMQQLRQRVIASYHLGPLDGEETKGYIEHRLHHVGWSDNPRLEDGVFRRIYSATGGIPRRINTLCDRILLAAFLSEKTRIGEEDVEAVLEELREEQAPAADAPVWSARSSARPVAPVSAGVVPLNGAAATDAKLDVPEGIADQLAALAGELDATRYEARLANVEKTLGATLALLQQLVSENAPRKTAGDS
ncbi:MAG: XrtA-associated ATPase [Rhodocyclaceae bacterium]|nr:XrtA-associated ATPase [Rhodocyclaceae bacterium]